MVEAGVVNRSHISLNTASLAYCVGELRGRTGLIGLADDRHGRGTDVESLYGPAMGVKQLERFF